MNKNSIVLNGKRYDANTGVLLGTVTDSQFRPIKARKATPKTTKVLAPPTVTTPTVATHAAMKPLKKVVDRSHHAPKIATRKPIGSKTLMRSVVKKPNHTPHPIVKKHYPAAISSPLITPKPSAHTVDMKRLHRAKQVGKSARIGKFQDMVSSKITPKIAPIAVAPAPAHSPLASTSVHRHSTPHTRKETIFEQAIANANSHEQPAHKVHKKSRSKRRRLLHSATSLTAVLVIGVSIMYLNKGSMELQLASVRAGFQASMPGYQPAGFQQAGTETKDDKVAITFTSPLDNSNFTLSQESSNWDSQTLFDSVVASNNNKYQTVLSGGRTIFLYGNNQATWVDGGILYKVQGNANLTKDQISNLASSM
jgi:Domain of unknown function (DUF4367)